MAKFAATLWLKLDLSSATQTLRPQAMLYLMHLSLLRESISILTYPACAA